SGKPTFIRF
uniref:FMRFamide-like neuropeptide AF5 n=1 Tax=Ascaris suum TaxID=6253 RepID=FAR5_ASCSU|nr:RecName: Full=FMRFamide-like neuropeptide AF5 [Ascaris suum]